jgi:hypothetical protein
MLMFHACLSLGGRFWEGEVLFKANAVNRSGEGLGRAPVYEDGGHSKSLEIDIRVRGDSHGPE